MRCFCQECGSENVYTLNKPKFCGNCGNSFGGKVVKASKIAPAEEEEVIEEMPDGDFKIEIDSTPVFAKLTIEQIASQKPTGFASRAGNFTPEMAMQELKETAKTKRIEVGDSD